LRIFYLQNRREWASFEPKAARPITRRRLLLVPTSKLGKSPNYAVPVYGEGAEVANWWFPEFRADRREARSAGISPRIETKPPGDFPLLQTSVGHCPMSLRVKITNKFSWGLFYLRMFIDSFVFSYGGFEALHRSLIPYPFR